MMSDYEILSDAEREAINAVMHETDLLHQTVLIVEDDQFTREMLAEILQLNGISCLAAASVAEALSWLATDKSIGLVITDLRMHPQSGLTLIRNIRESDRAQMPIVIMSGDAGVRDAIDAMHLDVVDFLLKPFDPEQLVQLLHEELGIQAL